MKLYMSDLYRVELHYPLDEVQNDILYYLYQPLIGSNALNLYMMLYMEGKRMKRFLKPSTLSRLFSFISINLLDLEKQLKTLEAIGLLKTYVKHDNDITQYVFIMQSPLSLQAFFKNQILSSLLRESLTKEDYQKTISYFSITKEDINGYEDITSSFTDVFEIQYQRQKPLKLKESVYQKTTQDIQVKYDVEFLKRCLQDYQVSMNLLHKDDLIYVSQLGYTYSIDALTLAGFIKDCINSHGLDKKQLKSSIQKFCDIDKMKSFKEVYHKQPLQYQSDSLKSDPLSLHMKYLDKISPYDLLKEKQGGKEPVYYDLSIVETLMVQLGLKPAVVNVLIEYVLGKNKNRLSKRYCEAIGASWARKHIETAEDAYKELMNDEEVSVEHQIEDEKDTQLDQREVEALLKELREELI